MKVSVEGCKFVQLKQSCSYSWKHEYYVSVEGCKFVQLKLKSAILTIVGSMFQLKDVSLYNWNEKIQFQTE